MVISSKIMTKKAKNGYILRLFLSHRGDSAETLREGFKYYFADFVRKGGTPPPFTDFFPAKKELRIWGVPAPPFTDFPRKNFFKKG